MVSQIYPAELQFNKANTSDTVATFVDLNLFIFNDTLSKFMINVTIFILKYCQLPILDGDVHRSTSYRVYISQLI